MNKGPLRTAIESFFHDNLNPGGEPNWIQRVFARHAEFREVVQKLLAVNQTMFWFVLPGLIESDILYSLTGASFAIDHWREAAGNGGVPDISKIVAEALSQAGGNPLIREIAESYGALYTEPILAVFRQYAGRDDVDPLEFYRAVQGISRELEAFGALADFAVEGITAGQFDAFGRMTESMNKAMGVDFVSYDALKPVLDFGLKPGLETYYKRLYRPTRFTISDLRDLYALGQITREDLVKTAQNQGWRDVDIDKWILLSFRTLSQGEVLEAWRKGKIGDDEVVRRLRALGNDPADIPLILELNPKDNPNNERDVSASTARQAYRDNLIPESELRELLGALKYGTQEIDLIVAIERAKNKTQVRSLSLGQIKAAWEDNVLSDQEATHWLEEDGFAADQIEIILATWRVEIAPKYRKLNSGTILGAYVEGVISRGAAKDKLVSVGIAPEDAELQIKLAETRNPEAFGQLPSAKARKLTPGVLSELVGLGLLTPAQMSARLQEVGYGTDDANLLAEAARLRALPGPRELSQSAITGAYLAGVIDRPKANTLLLGIGFNQDQVAILLDTFETQHADEFGLPAPARTRTLSPSALLDLYMSSLLSDEQYAARLVDLGLSPEDAGLELARAQQLKAPGQRVLTQSAIERAYLAGVYDRQTAFERLVGLDFTEADANTILDTVETENPAAFSPNLVQSSRMPSITTLVNALQNGIIDEQAYFARAQEIGYSVPDAQLYLSVSVKTEKKASKSLTPGQILAAYGKGLWSRGTALDRLTSTGYSTDDATLLLRIEKDSIQLTETWDSLLSGSIGPFDAISTLIQAHYADQDIYDAFASLGAITLSQMGIDLAQLQDTLTAIPGGQ